MRALSKATQHLVTRRNMLQAFAGAGQRRHALRGTAVVWAGTKGRVLFRGKKQRSSTQTPNHAHQTASISQYRQLPAHRRCVRFAGGGLLQCSRAATSDAHGQKRPARTFSTLIDCNVVRRTARLSWFGQTHVSRPFHLSFVVLRSCGSCVQWSTRHSRVRD